jgi:hypothetical protein
MKSILKKSLIRLDQAVLCLDCSCISDANRECPACCSRALLNLSAVLNRPSELCCPRATVLETALESVAA